MNKLIISGRLTATPSEVGTKRETKYCFACIANNDIKDHPTFIDIVAFGKQAEFLSKYFQKGSCIEVVGGVAENKKGRLQCMADSISFPPTNKKEAEPETVVTPDFPY